MNVPRDAYIEEWRDFFPVNPSGEVVLRNHRWPSDKFGSQRDYHKSIGFPGYENEISLNVNDLVCAFCSQHLRKVQSKIVRDETTGETKERMRKGICHVALSCGHFFCHHCLWVTIWDMYEKGLIKLPKKRNVNNITIPSPGDKDGLSVEYLLSIMRGFYRGEKSILPAIYCVACSKMQQVTYSGNSWSGLILYFDVCGEDDITDPIPSTNVRGIGGTFS